MHRLFVVVAAPGMAWSQPRKDVVTCLIKHQRRNHHPKARSLQDLQGMQELQCHLSASLQGA